MANPRPWPFYDDDRPSGSVRPLSQADVQAILAQLGDDPDQLLASTRACFLDRWWVWVGCRSCGRSWP
jgi:hypothetical protein